ncbi:MAG: histidine phosphatase family protein, partial [Chloroflexota bacterium]
QSENNANVDHPGMRLADPPLTDMGVAQARHLARYLTDGTDTDRASDMLAWRYGGYEHLNMTFDRLLTSPMLRSLQTTKPIASALGVPVKVWLDIYERGGLVGRGDERTTLGVTRTELRRDYPNYDIPQAISDAGWWRGGEESRDASRVRALKTAAKLRHLAKSEWHHKNVLLVSHAGFMDALLKAILLEAMPEIDETSFFYFYNTSISRIDFLANGHMGIRYLNRIAHLPPEQVS